MFFCWPCLQWYFVLLACQDFSLLLQTGSTLTTRLRTDMPITEKPPLHLSSKNVSQGSAELFLFFFLARCEELSRDCRRDWQRFYAPFHSAPNLFIQTVLDSWPMFGGHELGLEWLEIWWSFVGRGGFSCKSRENTAPNTHTRRLHISTQE